MQLCHSREWTIIKQAEALLTAYGFSCDLIPCDLIFDGDEGPKATVYNPLSENVVVWKIEALAAPALGDIFVLVVNKAVKGIEGSRRSHVVDFCTEDIYE